MKGFNCIVSSRHRTIAGNSTCSHNSINERFSCERLWAALRKLHREIGNLIKEMNWTASSPLASSKFLVPISDLKAHHPKIEIAQGFISKRVRSHSKCLSDSEVKTVYETLVSLSQDSDFLLFCFIVCKFPHLRASWTCESTQKAINNALICVHYCCLIIGRSRVCYFRFYYWLPFNGRLLSVRVAEENASKEEKPDNLLCKCCNC